MALPVRLDGLGITNPCADTPSHYDTSLKITAPLTALIMEQSNQYPNTIKTEQIRVKKEEVKARKHRQQQEAAKLKDKLHNNMQRAMSLSTEKGSSSWLYPCYQLQSMVMHCTRVLFVTLVASDMAGIHQICLFSVPVTNSSQWSML